MTGKIVRLVRDKGFGFLRGSDGKEYFFHRSAIQNAEWDSVQEGAPISQFIDADGPKGPRAESVFLA